MNKMNERNRVMVKHCVDVLALRNTGDQVTRSEGKIGADLPDAAVRQPRIVTRGK